MRVLKLALLLTFLLTSSVLAQDNPTVEIVLSPATAAPGDTVAADIYVRNGVNVAGIDIGIAVDENCLQILDRVPGDYLPTTEEGGAFSAFSELNEHDTRLAAALTDRTKYVSGDGVFYRVQLQVICDNGVAPLEVVYGQVTSYIDPNAEIIDVISYEMDENTLAVVNTQLLIGDATAADLVQQEPTTIVEATPAAGTDEPEATQAPVDVTEAEESSSPAPFVLFLGGLAFILIGFMIFLIVRSGRNREEDK